MKYNCQWLLERFDAGEELEYLFFWGHTSSGAVTGKECLSQWYPASFVFDDVEYSTAEHWMMAQKALLFGDDAIFQEVVNAESPKKAKELGRQIQSFGPDPWNENKVEIVTWGNIHKFTQNPDLSDYLRSTEGLILVEASPVDGIWGINLSADAENIENPYCWDGENLLGFALMAVRDCLNRFEDFNLLDGPMLPPWKKYPNLDRSDMGWQMGYGEDYMLNFSKYWSKLSAHEKEIYKIMYPTPRFGKFGQWEGWLD